MSGDHPQEPQDRQSKKLSNSHYFKILGYLLTAVWIVYILMVTKGDMKQPMFDYIFVVPLAGWIIGMIIAHFVRKRAGADRP
jgi:hypothetical protein